MLAGGTLKQLIRGDEAAAAAYMDWAVQTGFNGLDFFGGNLTWQAQKAPDALRVLPQAVAMAKDRGLYTSIRCLTDTNAGGAFDKAAHVQACGQIISGLLSVANEPYHDSQDDATHQRGNLMTWGKSSPVPYALGAAKLDELDKPCDKGGVYPMSGGSYIHIHLRRSQDWPIQIARLRELEAVSACHGVPVMDGEKIGWDETAEAGRRLNVPEAFYMAGAFARVMELGIVGFGQHTLRSELPGSVQQQCADALVAGVRDVDSILPADQRSTLKNGHWADSPATGRFFDTQNGEQYGVTTNRVWRVTSGVVGDKAAVILAGIAGDPGVRFQGGWRDVRKVAQFDTVALYESAR